MIRRPPRSTRMTHSFPTRRSSDLHGATRTDCAAELKDFPDLVLRAAQANAFFGFDQRAFDQARIRDHCIQTGVIASFQYRLCFVLLRAQPLAWWYSSGSVRRSQLFTIWRRSQIFDQDRDSVG